MRIVRELGPGEAGFVESSEEVKRLLSGDATHGSIKTPNVKSVYIKHIARKRRKR